MQTEGKTELPAGVQDEVPCGLHEKEVLTRRKKAGLNEFAKQKKSALKLLIRQFSNSIIYMLIVAGIISFSLGDTTGGTAIVVILALNALLGFSQEYRSERTAERLSKLVAHRVLVRREGVYSVIEQKYLVPGDIVVVKQGDIVPADCRVVHCNLLNVNESQLTGESVPVAKKEGDQIFSGSIVEKGEGAAEVTATGDRSELGKIARLSMQASTPTQYEKSLQDFGSFLIRLTIASLAALFIGKLFITGGSGSISTQLVFVIALAVAVVPEAMPVITTVTLASGALRLSRKHVVVKKVSALEDLGNVTILCTDKTGTITENSLTIEGVVADDTPLLERISYACREILDEKHKRVGSSFDEAIANYVSPDVAKEVQKRFAILQELPFDPEARRRRVVLYDRRWKIHYLVAIGSAQTILDLVHPPHKDRLLKEVVQDGMQGLRHLAYAVREVEYTDDFDIAHHEKGMRFVGFYKMVDPLKPTATHTIEVANRLGVAVKIISGDSPEVAKYVGMQVGLLGEGDRVITGDEIDHMSMAQVRRAARSCAVFARITPEQKYGLIKILKETDSVAYQGDGINDAPALKLADVGIAVHTASDVAKESADIILLKEDLGVLINGIRFGRMTFTNINKYIRHTMVGNFALFISLGASFLFLDKPPLLGLQLLFTTLITDVPMVAIASDNVDESELKRPRKHSIHGMLLSSLILAIVTVFFQMLFMVYLRYQGHSDAWMQSYLYLFIVFLQLTTIFSVRGRGHVWEGVHPSGQLVAAVAAVCAVAVIVPNWGAVGSVFGFVPLSARGVGAIFLAMVGYVLVIDQIKRWYYRLVPAMEG